MEFGLGSMVPTLRPKKLLIVDNVKSNIKLLCKPLEIQGHYCEVAVNGLIAVHMLKATLGMKTENLYLRDYDAVFMNIIVPVMNGCEVTKEIRKLGYNGPIIGITNGSNPNEAVAFMQAGASDILLTPFEIRDIYNLMHSLN